jgi:hypothetical protein
MAKKKFLVVARNTKTSEQGLMTSKGNVPFHSKTAKIIEDPGLANEIDTEYGLKGKGDVWVERDDMLEHHSNYHSSNKVHNYFFGSNKAYREAWDDIFGGKDGHKD